MIKTQQHLKQVQEQQVHQDAFPSQAGTSRWDRTAQFPWKLHRLLEDSEVAGFDHIVSWMPNELAFRVHQNDLFVKQVLPLYFRQTQYKSFQRQCKYFILCLGFTTTFHVQRACCLVNFLLLVNMWGFERVTCGMNSGGYSHIFFVRGQVDLCKNMSRTKIKKRRNQQWSPSSMTMPSPLHVTNAWPSNKVQSNPVPRHPVTPTLTTSLRQEVSVARQNRFAEQPDVTLPLLPSSIQGSSSKHDLFDNDSFASCLLWDPAVKSSTATDLTSEWKEATQSWGMGSCDESGNHVPAFQQRNLPSINPNVELQFVGKSFLSVENDNGSLHDVDERNFFRSINTTTPANAAATPVEDDWSLELQPTPLPPHQNCREW
eukprot:Nitzschia sp. Nitz4//scaffold26_size159584//145502//146642//NITZ4_002519-RA/size159584-snap-gene-0.49-mRNA-1//-1//CDS//3329545166//6889//frame0